MFSLPRRCLSTSPLFLSKIGMQPVPFDPNVVHFDFTNPYPDPSPDAPVPKKNTFDLRPPYLLTVKGPLGELQYPLKACVRLAVQENYKLQQLQERYTLEEDLEYKQVLQKKMTPTHVQCVKISVEFPTVKRQKTIWGTTRANVANMVHGVTEGWTWKLRLVGVGYRAALNKNNTLQLALGNANLIEMPVPKDLSVVCPTQDTIEVSGIDKRVVSQFAANIRKHRPPEPYNQKGVFVNGETIRKKKSKK